MNTAVSTRVMPTTAPVISRIALVVACRGGRPSLAMIRSTFSTTTMASSTMMPIASTMPNIVSTLIEKPASSITAKVPSSAIGATMAGISV
ncbi:hypothetical protein NB706_002905 [Xanthomonas sacchari]|nr:hypothetical protein [Xanthomonas sacchari]